jgi:hypothetical protein
LGLLKARKGVSSRLLACSDAQKEASMPIPREGISQARPDEIEPQPDQRRLLVGTWVTSFVAWYPGVPEDGLLPFKVANSFVKWNTPAATFDQGWIDFKNNPDNKADLEALTFIFPAPVAALSCFVFASDGTCQVIEGRNHQSFYDSSILDGVFNIGWNSLGAVAGDITFSVIDITMKFVLVSKDEMRFIIAHGSTVDDFAPVAAGTMRRALVFKRHPSFWELISSSWGGILKIIGLRRS